MMNLTDKNKKDIKKLAKKIFKEHNPKDGDESLALTHLVLLNCSFEFSQLTVMKRSGVKF